MLFQIGNLHRSYRVLCWLEGEWMQIFQSILLQIADFHCPLLAVNLEHAILAQSIAPTAGKMWICELFQKFEWKLNIALTAVSDPAVCVSLAWRQETCRPNHNTWRRNHSSGATNRRPAGRMRPIEDHWSIHLRSPWNRYPCQCGYFPWSKSIQKGLCLYATSCILSVHHRTLKSLCKHSHGNKPTMSCLYPKVKLIVVMV